VICLEASVVDVSQKHEFPARQIIVGFAKMR